MHRRVTIVLLSSALCLRSSLGHAQTEQRLADLKVLFEKDPAAGFVEAESVGVGLLNREGLEHVAALWW